MATKKPPTTDATPALALLAAFARRAALGDPTTARDCMRAFVQHSDLIEKVMEAALWDESAVRDFETQHGRAYLLQGRWGKCWLAPASTPVRTLVPHAPIIAPRALVALARALITYVQEGHAA